MNRRGKSRARALGLMALLGTAAPTGADGAPDGAPAGPPATAPTSPDNGWSLHTQATYVYQGNSSFPAAYSGPNSFGPNADTEHTFSFTLFLDRAAWNGADLIYNPEIFQGHGLSSTYGIAGFPNGEAVKSGFANLHYNTSRLFLRQVIGLGGEKEKLEDDQNQREHEIDVDRLTFSVGKFSANDFFDDNAYSHDPRTQFMNWSLWESSAWDYPADIVGFTAGFVAEWNTKQATLRYGIFMEPTKANGDRLDPHIGKAYGQILQYDARYAWDGHAGTVRPFVYWNRAHMGSYEEAASQPYPANIVLTEAYRSKVGAGVSWDQELTSDLGVFARLSWNDGKTESFTFTEVDRSVAAGLSLKGGAWGRPPDTVGLAGVVNGIASDHQKYLADGGTGLLLGDGGLSYAPEQIIEVYYAFQPWKWLQVSADYQYVWNPGYNSARGPVPVYALRGHVQF
jgi:high affinity Mn2+ porin